MEKRSKFKNVEPKEVKVPFKKVWTPISKCPSWYLKWVAENWKEDTDRNAAICRAADHEYQFRKEHGILDDDETENIYNF